MLARLRTLWERIATGLWFLPATLTVAAIAVAGLAIEVDIDAGGAGGWWLHQGSADDASTLLSSLTSAMITMATLAISITMVVLTLAAGQLGPRLIRIFMSDKQTQASIGFLLATIVYLILVFRSLNTGQTDGDVPHFAVSLGSLLVLICIFVLLSFIHHLARSIVSDHVVRQAGQALDAAIAELLPDAAADDDSRPQPLRQSDVVEFSLPAGGYVQAVEFERLVRHARQCEAVIELTFRPGHHLLPGGGHVRVSPAAALRQSLREHIADSILIGPERTASQDLEFSVRQLVEVALRALSPGINDPFTAIAVIERLGVSLARALQRGPTPSAWCDEHGEPRVLVPPETFRGLVDTAFSQIRQAGEGRPAILITMLATLGKLAELARDEDHRQVIADHVGLVAAAGERSIAEPYDLAHLDERRQVALALLARRPGGGD